jgi:hypothetical protein
VRVTTDDHPFTFFDGNTGVESSPLELSGERVLSLEKGFHMFDPLLKEGIFIPVFEQKKDLPLSNKRKGSRDRNAFKHFGLKVKESLEIVNLVHGEE